MSQTQLAISSIKVQKFKNLYSLEVGFYQGTIFEDLNLPFTGVCCDVYY